MREKKNSIQITKNLFVPFFFWNLILKNQYCQSESGSAVISSESDLLWNNSTGCYFNTWGGALLKKTSDNPYLKRLDFSHLLVADTMNFYSLKNQFPPSNSTFGKARSYIIYFFFILSKTFFNQSYLKLFLDFIKKIYRFCWVLKQG